MADVNITIFRQDYSDAQDKSELNGYKPCVVSEALTGDTVGTSDTGIIEQDFKDHKTVFVIDAAADANVTFLAGDTYQGAKDLLVEAPTGLSMIWLDSAKFINKATGEIKFTTDASIDIFGYEMR